MWADREEMNWAATLSSNGEVCIKTRENAESFAREFERQNPEWTGCTFVTRTRDERTHVVTLLGFGAVPGGMLDAPGWDAGGY
jgi:hypothetical protein